MPIASFLSVVPQRLLATLLLSLASLQSQAFTLGAIQGAVLMGRPLDVAVQVQLDPNESVTSACFEADVFHGDVRQNPSGVTVRLETASLPSTALVHISSRSRVDEPIVTVYLRAGCAQMSSRRYSLLVDLVSEPATTPMPRVAALPLVNPSTTASSEPAVGEGSRSTAQQRVATTPRPATNAAPRQQSRARSQGSRVAKAAPSRRVAPARPTAAAAPATAPSRAAPGVVPKVPAAARGEGQSRLTLDPLEMLSERVATLESNATAAPPAMDARAARESERLDRLEVSLNALLALAHKNEANLQDVRSRMDKAQADRWDNPLIYLLLGLLLLSLIAIAYLVSRMNRRQEHDGTRWFDARANADADSVPPQPLARSAPSPLSQAAAVPDAAAPAGSGPVPLPERDRLPIEPTKPMPQPGGVRAADGGNGQVDVSLVEMSESTFDRLMQSGAAQGALRNPRDTVPMAQAHAVPPVVAGSTMPAVPRIDVDRLIDIRQRAEFFVTLGQTDQAVQVLEARISQDAASCPQVHLDLLKLFHSLGLKADFNQVRGDFTRLFNASLPEFSDFDLEGRSLEEYPGVIDRLIAAWRRPTVVATLEQMVCRDPVSEAARDTFDLAAFRDLLLLHAVAQSVVGTAGGPSRVAPAAAVAAGTSAQIDIDLSELLMTEAVPTLAMPRDDAPAAASPRAATPTSPVPPGNLIDFDLSDVGLAGQPGKDA